MIGASTRLIVGPPGTGKTERCISIVKQELEGGLRPDRIAFVTFTRSAADEAHQRVGLACPCGEFPWFRTIHSTAFRLSLLSPGQVMQCEHWGHFAHLHGSRFTLKSALDDGGMAALPQHTPDDHVRALYDWARNTRRTPSEALAASGLRVSADALRRFIERYEAYKSSLGVVDFIDMIELALCDRPDVAVAVIDEAQDLSPLQIAAVESWFGACDRVYVAGDDDQSIFGFQGAAPNWIVQLSNTPGVEVEVLRQSRRVPRAAHAFAQSIIGRNKHRVPKDYLPRDVEGCVERMPLGAALRSLDVSEAAFALVRNRCFGEEVVDELRRLDLPYVSSLGIAPMDRSRGVVRAVRAARLLLRGESIVAADLESLVRRVPSRHTGLLPHGFKSKLTGIDPLAQLTTAEVQALLRDGSLLAVLRARGVSAVMRGPDVEDARYVERVLARYGEGFQPKLEVATIHSSKGREASQVVVLPELTRASFDELIDARRGGREAENRVAYVAATRTSDRLVVVHPRTRHSYPYPR